jgi:hypothetical protein
LASDQVDQDNFAAARHDQIGADHPIDRVVGAFHQDIRLEDCCSMLGAEPKRAREYLDEIQARDTSLDQFLKHRKRARDEKPKAITLQGRYTIS